jgi:hypothetical protein
LAINHEKEKNNVELETLTNCWKMLYPAKYTDVPVNNTICLKYGYDQENPSKIYSVSTSGIKSLAMQKTGVTFSSA